MSFQFQYTLKSIFLLGDSPRRSYRILNNEAVLLFSSCLCPWKGEFLAAESHWVSESALWLAEPPHSLLLLAGSHCPDREGCVPGQSALSLTFSPVQTKACQVSQLTLLTEPPWCDDVRNNQFVKWRSNIRNWL